MDLNEITLNALQEWVDTGKSVELSSDMQRYFECLELCRSLYSKYHSREFILTTLMKTDPVITRKDANTLLDDSLNFFYANNDVKKEAWRNIYAEKFDNLAKICLKDHDFAGSRQNLEAAMKARGLDHPDPQDIPQDFYDRRTIVYVTDPKFFGIEKVSRNTLAKKIDEMKIDEREKTSLLRDAGIIDLKIIEDTYEEFIPED